MATHLDAARSRLEAWQFGQLVFFFVLYLILLPTLTHAIVVKLLASLLVLNAMLVAASASPRTLLLRSAVWALWAFSVVGMMVEDFEVHRSTALTYKVLSLGAHAVIALLCSAGILSVVFRAGRVTVDGILASVAAYQLIGFCFAQIFATLILCDPTSLHVPDHVVLHGEAASIEMVYFSFVTLATLGYGDIVPHTSLARSVAIIEAMVGQFYVAVVVAVLVSAFVAQRLEDRMNESHE